MRPRDYVEHDAPESVEAHWLVLDDGLLHIWVDRDMDDLAQQRFIQRACELNGLNPRRRGIMPLPLLPLSGGHAAGQSKVVASAAFGGGVIAVSIAAAALLPAILGNSHAQPRRPPPAAAPAPAQPMPPSRVYPPAASPSKPPSLAVPAAASTQTPARMGVSVHAAPASVKAGVRVPGMRSPLPKLPVSPPMQIPPPVTRQPSSLLAVSLPRAGVQVSVSPRLSMQVRLGSARLAIQAGRISSAATSPSPSRAGRRSGYRDRQA